MPRYSEDAKIAFANIAKARDFSDRERLAALDLFIDAHPISDEAKRLASVVLDVLDLKSFGLVIGTTFGSLQRALVLVAIDIGLDLTGPMDDTHA